MYLSHFRLREPPFSITPDPRFLYMSDRHREALAHLLYGVSAHGGFVQLTGEVGTGKTSVCRCLLDQLPPHVDVALVLNPRVSSVELLATVCEELRIPTPPAASSPKALVDLLYRYLLDAHGRGRRTVLIIDEAQNLAPDVLEQVRLLTNLETTREKLLQVILIGQPELAAVLEQRGLRQLAQRVTARYHLEPLARTETRAYVRHRLAVAGRGAGLFTDGAIRAAHRRSGGVPRLINAICDRALLGAYAQGRARIDAATVRRAAAELLGHPLGLWARWRRAIGAVGLLVGLVVALVGLVLVLRAPSEVVRGPVDPPRAAVTPARATGVVPVSVVASIAPTRPTSAPRRLDALLGDPALAADRASALSAVLARWGIDGEGRVDCAAGSSGGLRCVDLGGSWDTLRRLDLPAVVELAAPDGVHRYAAVTALDERQATLRLGGQTVTVPLDELDRVRRGRFVVLWLPPPVALPIGPGTRGPSVDWVRVRLARIEGTAAPEASGRAYDAELRRRVEAFQRGRALPADGVVSGETALLLTLAVREPGMPRLTDAGP